MSCRVLVPLVLAACSHASDVEAPPPVRAPHAPDPIASGTPHGGAIVAIAATEQGDAALTLDNLHTLRLWPTLDGQRPAIPIAAMSPAELALTHAGDDLLVAILDEAGHARILRLGLDGSVRGRVQLPGDTAIEQVVALDGTVLVLRDDQSIEQYDASGALRGHLVPQPGERIAAIAARNGSAIAQVTSEAHADRELRWIVLDGEPRWGTTIVLPEAYRPGTLALAPDRHHVAVMGPSTTVILYDVVTVPTRVGAVPVTNTTSPVLGFVDGEHFVVADGITHTWWSAKAAADPWAAQPAVQLAAAESGAIADGVVLAGVGAALAIDDGAHTKYLGWKQLAIGTLVPLATGDLVVQNGSELTWLDDKLDARHTLDLAKTYSDSPYGQAIDDRHVVLQRNIGGTWEASVVDATDPNVRISLGSGDGYDLVQYEPTTQTLYVGRAEIKRWKMDWKANAATPLAPLTGSAATTMLVALDPARAHGAIALTQAYSEDESYYRVHIYFDEPGTKPIAAKKSFRIDSSVVAIDGEGNTYLSSGETGSMLRKMTSTAEKVATKIPLGDGIYAAAVSHDGTQIALLGRTTLRLVDTRDGTLRWEVPQWATSNLAFARDDRRVVLRATNGQIVIDRATGKRVATSCGWGFGLHDEAPSLATFGAPPACED